MLVTDGGDNCAPPDPCKAAEEVAKRGVEMSISVVGFQVNDRVRRQLRCIAAAGGGSYVDVGDADQLGDELAALLSRAFRSYEPTGTQVEGTADEARRRRSARACSWTRSRPGRRRPQLHDRRPRGPAVIVSATAIPPQGSSGAGAFVLRLFPPGEDDCPRPSQRCPGRDVRRRLRVDVEPQRPDGAGRPAGQVHGDDLDPARGGNGIDEDVPVELAVQFLKPGDT